MARSFIIPFLSILLSFSFTTALSIRDPAQAISRPSSRPSSQPDAQISDINKPLLSSVSNKDTQWYYVSADASQIIPIDSSTSKPTNVNGTLGGPGTARNSYTFGIGNHHGDPVQRPALGKFLFECAFYMLDKIPASGQGVWSPAPHGKYMCQNGNAPGVLRAKLEDNKVEWDMSWHDLGFMLKVLHDIEGVKDEAQFFDFHFNYTPDTATTEYDTVVYGSWDRPGVADVATSKE